MLVYTTICISRSEKLIAAQQGLAVATQAYDSKPVQDFLAQGSITHKLIYATLIGGTGYLMGSFAFGEGVGGVIKTTQRSVTGSIPIFGALLNRVNDLADPPSKKSFTQTWGPAIAGVAGMAIGMYIG